MDIKTIQTNCLYIASQIESIDIIIHFTPFDYVIDNESQIQNFEPTCFVEGDKPKYTQNDKEYGLLLFTHDHYSIYQVLKCHSYKEAAWMIFRVNGIVYICRCRIEYLCFEEQQGKFTCSFNCFFKPKYILLAKDAKNDDENS